MSTPPLPGGYPPMPPNAFGPATQWGPQPWQAGPYPQGPYPQAYPQPVKKPPRKFWYGIGATLIAIGLILGLGVGIGGLVRIKGIQPQSESIFGNGGSTTVRLNPGSKKVVFIANSLATGEHPVRCITTGTATERASLKTYEGTMSLNRWRAMFTLEAAQGADYTVSCIGIPSDTFGVGGYASPTAFVGSVFSIFGGLALALAGAVTTIVAAVLRRRRNQAPGW